MTVGGPAAPTTEDPLLNRVLSERYRIIEKLGEGGMGVVYLAEHIVIEKKIALKVLFPDLTRRADLVQRFMQEAKSASRIVHENVIDITDFGQSPEGYVFIAMEYLIGQDLGQVLKASGPMPWQRAQPIILQIVKALRAAHERGIVHRDMKPENIFVLQRDDGREFVKVLDFGIAKVLGLDDDAPRLTRTGMIFGTPEYMSPEQAQGQPVDHRVDIYAVGCILYHMLTGEVPFKAESFMGILSKHMLEAPLPPSTRNPTIEPQVESIINRAMEKDPAKRFQTMREFVEALVPLGHIPDVSGAISLSTGMPVHRTGMPSKAPVPVPLPGSVPVSRPPTAAPLAGSHGDTRPLPHSTRELEGRGTTPLAQSNPEVRRSQTAFLSREGGPPPRPKSSNVVLIAVAVGAVALAGIVTLILRGPGTAASTAAGTVTPPAAGVPGGPAAVPAGAAAPAAPAAGIVDRAAPPPSSGALPANANGAAAAPARKGKDRDSSRTRRSSREVVDSLTRPADEAAPERARTPAELKNPFAPPAGP